MAIDTATLGDCVGKYRASFGVLEAVLKGGHLEAQTTGQPTFTIFANATDTFFYKDVDAQRLTLERNAGGFLYQDGGLMRCRRMATQE